MTEEEKKELIGRFLTEAVLPACDLLEEDIDRLNGAELGEFGETIEFLLSACLEDVVSFAGVDDFEKIPSEVRCEIVRVLVTSFNSALPLDHKFAVAVLVMTDDIGDNTAIVSVLREVLPGRHDLLSQNFLPMIYAKNADDFENSKIDRIEMHFPEDEDI